MVYVDDKKMSVLDPMTQAFISYRRKDTDAAAQHIAQHLRACLGPQNVFIDMSIPVGADYKEVLAAKLASADKVLVLIGDRWLESLGPGGRRRLDDPDDVLRFEIEYALKAGTILPVLIGDASMPDTDALPSSLSGLANINAVRVRFDHDLPFHLNRLAKDVIGPAPSLVDRVELPFREPVDASSRRRGVKRVLALSLAAFALGGVAVWWAQSGSEQSQRLREFSKLGGQVGGLLIDDKAALKNPGDSKNCGDFDTWDEAQAWFEHYYPTFGDVARLDGDGDKVACESLPGSPSKKRRRKRRSRR